LTIPAYLYDKVFEKLEETSGDQAFYTKKGITFVDCYEVGQMAPLFFMINQHWLEVDP